MVRTCHALGSSPPPPSLPAPNPIFTFTCTPSRHSGWTVARAGRVPTNGALFRSNSYVCVYGRTHYAAACIRTFVPVQNFYLFWGKNCTTHNKSHRASPRHQLNAGERINPTQLAHASCDQGRGDQTVNGTGNPNTTIRPQTGPVPVSKHINTTSFLSYTV